jgi:hypothetical protein
MFRHSIVALLLAGAIQTPAAPSGTASGEFTAGKRPPIRPKFATAFEARDQRDARKTIVEVVLSDAPVDAAAAARELDPHMDIINQAALKDRNYVLLWVRPANDVSMNATYSPTMTQYLARADRTFKAEITEYSADRVTGRVFTTEPIKTMDGELYAANLTFSAVITHAPPSTKLPADGGEPGKALTALFAAIAKKSWDGIAQNVTERNAKMFGDPDDPPAKRVAEALDMLGFWLPKKGARITGGLVRESSAFVEVEGEVYEGQKALYLARMIKVGTRWVFDHATNAGLIPSSGK